MSASPRRPATARQYCTFLVGHLYLGIDVRHVQEVLRIQEVTPVPLAPAAVEGLINLRGQIVTALNMRRRLGLPPRPEGNPPVNMVVCTGEGTASLLIDEIGDVFDAESTTLESLPENVPAGHRELIQGVCKWGDRLLLILDIERTLALDATAA